MSANLRLRISTLGGAATSGPIAALALAAPLALGGCAGWDQENADDATTDRAAMCEQQHRTAGEECVQQYDPIENPEQLQACRDQALGDLQECRGG